MYPFPFLFAFVLAFLLAFLLALSFVLAFSFVFAYRMLPPDPNGRGRRPSAPTSPPTHLRGVRQRRQNGQANGFSRGPTCDASVTISGHID